MSKSSTQHIVYFAPPHANLAVPYATLLSHAAAAGITVSSTLNPAVSLVVAASGTALPATTPTSATCLSPNEFIDLVKSATPPSAAAARATPPAVSTAKATKRGRDAAAAADNDHGDDADGNDGVASTSPKRARPNDHQSPSDHVVVFTGTLPSGRTRDEASAEAQEHGYTVKNSITKATTILVYGDKAGTKIDKAREQGVLVLSETEWMQRLQAEGGDADEMQVDEEEEEDEPKPVTKGKAKAPTKPTAAAVAAPAASTNGGGAPSSHVVVFTGTLPSGRTRDEAIHHAESLGYTTKNSITKATTILVYGDKAGTKIDKAREQGVLVLSEAEWMARVGADPGAEHDSAEDDEDEPDEPPKAKKAAAKPAKKAAPAKKPAAGSAKKGVVVFSGTLPSGRTRAEATKEAEDAGYEVKNSITKATTILVTGEKGGAKIDKARDAGVEVVDEDEWIARLQEEAEEADDE